MISVLLLSTVKSEFCKNGNIQTISKASVATLKTCNWALNNNPKNADLKAWVNEKLPLYDQSQASRATDHAAGAKFVLDHTITRGCFASEGAEEPESTDTATEQDIVDVVGMSGEEVASMLKGHGIVPPGEEE